MFYKCDGCVTDVYKGIMANKCIYFHYIFCKLWHEPNGFHTEIPYSWIFVLVWTDPNAILSLDAKAIRRDLFLIENWTSRIFGTPMLRGFSPGIKASSNQPWVLLNSALRGWVVTSGSLTRNLEASWCGSGNGRDVIWRRAVSDWASALVRAVTCSCDKLVKRSWWSTG